MKDQMNETVGQLKKYRGVMAVLLFGSHAKKRAKPMSDVDIAVIVKKPGKKIESDIACLSSNTFDVVNFHRLPAYIQFEVLKYGKPLYIRDNQYFTHKKTSVLREYLDMSHLYDRMSKRVLSC